jgi:hypothetical protein
VLAAAVTLWALQLSFRHGRLAAPATFDDVAYFNDGLDRLEVLQSHGLWGLLRSLWDSPPHAPFSTLLACLSMGLFGVHDWAPYLANGLIVFGIIAFTDRLLWGAPLAVRALGLALVCALPLTEQAVTEFRPDFAVALLNAVGVIMLLTSSLTGVRPRRRVLTGAVFGLALLAKPAMCVLTGAMLGGALGLAVLLDRRLSGAALRRLLGSAAAVGLTALAVAAPYYLRNLDHVVSYIYNSICGQNQDVWAFRGSVAEHLGYYLWGPGVRAILGPYRHLVAALLLAGAVGVLATRRREAVLRAAAFAAVLLLALVVLNSTRVKFEYYGLTFYLLGVFAAVLSLRLACAGGWPRRHGLRRGALALLAFLALAALGQRPQHGPYGHYNNTQARLLNRACADVLATLRAHPPDDRPVIFVTMEWQVSFQTLQWLARREGLAGTFSGPYLWRDLAEYRRALEQSSFILAYQTDRPRPNFPGEQLAAATLALARSLKGFAEVRSFPGPDGVVYHLFERAGPGVAKQAASPPTRSVSEGSSIPR